MAKKTETELVELVNKARSFNEIMQDERFVLMFNTVSADLFHKWSTTADGAVAKDLWHQMRGMKALQSTLQTVIGEGVAASKELEAMDRSEKQDFGARPLTGSDIRRKAAG